MDNKKNKMKSMRISKILKYVAMILLICILIFEFISINKLKEEIDIIHTRVNTISKETSREKYVHFSLDDTILLFEDLYQNSNRYSTIFDNDTLKYLKQLHSRYGIVVSCYTWYQKENFDLSMLSAQYQQEFQDNSDWLRFGFHALDSEAKYETDADIEKLKKDYEKTVEQLVRITGGENCIDHVIRLHYYAGTKDGIQELANGKYRIKGLLAADNEGRKSYYFDDKISNEMYWTDKYIDNGIYFFNTDLRMENYKDITEKLKEYKTSEYKTKADVLITFTHEWKIKDYIVKKNIEKTFKFAIENEYGFYFPEDKLE